MSLIIACRAKPDGHYSLITLVIIYEYIEQEITFLVKEEGITFLIISIIKR